MASNASNARARSRANLQPVGPGNDLAVKHGAYAKLKLAPRAAELADELREVVPVYSPADEPAIAALAMVLAQLELATLVLSNVQTCEIDRVREGRPETKRDSDELRRLRADAVAWANAARRYLNDLGLTPTSRVSLGLSIAQARGAALRAHLAERYGGSDA